MAVPWISISSAVSRYFKPGCSRLATEGLTGKIQRCRPVQGNLDHLGVIAVGIEFEGRVQGYAAAELVGIQDQGSDTIFTRIQH